MNSNKSNMNILKKLLKKLSVKKTVTAYKFDDSFFSTTIRDIEEIDPKIEAEVYLAYSKVEQAKEIILDGIIRYPDREDLKFLLEKINNDVMILNKINTKSYLISVLAEKSTGISYPESFRICMDNEENMQTKKGQDILFKEIESRKYKSWALLFYLEIK